MARCPHCHKHFSVLEDEDPADFGCPRCGFGQDRNDDDDDLPSTEEEDDNDEIILEIIVENLS
jgi:hypothetical protein